MRPEKPVDVPLLFQLWADLSITRGEVAERMGVGDSQLTRLLARYRIPPRPYNYNNKAEYVSEDEERASRESLSIAPSLRAACEALKAKHFAERRAERESNTQNKVLNWRQGVCPAR